MPKKKTSEDIVKMTFYLDQNDSDFVREDAKRLGCYNEATGRYQWRKYVIRLIGLRQEILNLEKR